MHADALCTKAPLGAQKWASSSQCPAQACHARSRGHRACLDSRAVRGDNWKLLVLSLIMGTLWGSKGPFIRPLEMEEPVRNAAKGAGGGIRAGFPQFLLANMNTYAPILRVSRSRLPRLERWFQKKRTKREPHKQTMPQHPQGACVGGSKGDSLLGFHCHFNTAEPTRAACHPRAVRISVY